MSGAVLAVFAKAPVPGSVKTRLCPPLTLEEAAAGYEAMLLDVLDQAPPPGVERALWFTPEEQRGWFERAAPGWPLYAQRGPDLAARMAALFEVHAAQGHGRMVLRGSDSPTLPAETVAAAFAALDEADVAICPDRDGGYNLIGLCRPAPALFGLEMSTASVLEDTLARARREGLQVRLLPAWHDVDTVADLAQLEPCARAPRTTRWLATARASIER